MLTASNGNEGVQLFRQTPIELVITDVFMPGEEGLEVMRTLGRESSTVPIIAFTGGAEAYDVLDGAKSLDAQRILVKPFPVTEELIHAVRQELLRNAGHKATRSEE